MFLCVSHDNRSSHLYVSNVNGTKFSLSLEDLLYFNPKGTHNDSWVRLVTLYDLFYHMQTNCNAQQTTFENIFAKEEHAHNQNDTIDGKFKI